MPLVKFFRNNRTTYYHKCACVLTRNTDWYLYFLLFTISLLLPFFGSRDMLNYLYTKKMKPKKNKKDHLPNGVKV